jgi:hypothetical protein
MRRWARLAVCAVLGILLVGLGLLVPAHLRALEIRVAELAGRKTPGVVEEGFYLLEQGQLGSAQMLLAAARAQQLPGAEKLGLALGNLGMTFPQYLLWGGPDAVLERLFPKGSGVENAGALPMVPFLVRLENRETVLQYLRGSKDPLVLAVLEGEKLTNTVLFPPMSSGAGQAMETALAITGLLVKQQRLTPALRESLGKMARDAGAGAPSARFEQAILDLASLGQRFNWVQLSTFTAQIEDIETLRILTRWARQSGERLPSLFAAVYLSGTPAAVSDYLMEFSQSGLKDLGLSLRYGRGGVREVLDRKQRVYEGGARSALVRYNPLASIYTFALEYCWLMPRFALAAKGLLYLAGGFCLAAGVHFGRRPATLLEQPLQVRGLWAVREFLFALGFLLVVILLSEPFLAQDSQKVTFPFRLRLPMVGAAAPAGAAHPQPSIMNQLSFLTLLLFFVLQGLIYAVCLVKLAEIRRQNVSSAMKLKLLENEDHLFDAGLYLGFVGTIISLILMSLGVVKPSLMAGYSSTSFGIIFVTILKIFHVRPLRRKLILENEANPS